MTEEFKVAYNDREVLDGLKRTEEALKGIQKEVEKTGEAADKAFQDASKSATNLAQATTLSEAEIKKRRDENERHRAEIAAIRAKNEQEEAARRAKSQQQFIKDQAAQQTANAKTAQSVGLVTTAVALVTRAVGVLRGGFALLRVALLSLGIPSLVSALTFLVSKFIPLSKIVDEVEAAFSALSSAVKVVADRITIAGQAIAKFFKGDFKGAAEQMGQAFSGLGNAIVEAAEAGYDLEKRSQALRDRMTQFNVTVEKQNTLLQRQKELYDDGTKSIEERAKASERITALERDLAKQAIGLANEQIAIAKQKAVQDVNSRESLEAIAEAEIGLQKAIQRRDQVEFEAAARKRALVKEALEDAEKQAKALEKLRDAARPDGIQKDLQDVERQYNELVKIAEEATAKLIETQKRRPLSEDELAKLKELGDLQLQIEQRRLEALVDVASEYAEKEAEIDRKLKEEKAENARDEQRRQEQAIEDAKVLRDQQIDLSEKEAENQIIRLQKSGAKEKEIKEAQQAFDTLIQRARLNSELKFQQQLLDITDAGETQRIEEIRGKIALIQQELQNIDDAGGGEKKGLLSILGLDDPETRAALKETFDELIGNLERVAEARTREADAAVEAANRKVEAAENALEKELEDAKKGFANNSDLRRKELADAKKAQEEALKEREKAAEREAKIKRAAIVVDSIQQGQNLISASAKIFNSLAGIPFVGLPLAIAAVALMFGAFAKAKVDAFKLAAPPKLRKGAKIKGRTHEQGGEMAVSDSGDFYELERGEWVIGTQHSREHDAFLGNLNKGQYAGLDLAAIADEAKGSILHRHGVEVREIQARREDVLGKMSNAELVAAYMRGSGQIVDAINGKPEIYPWKEGYKAVKRSGSNKTTEVVLPE